MTVADKLKLIADNMQKVYQAGASSSGGGGGVTPSGTIGITENGTYDVKQYARAEVTVPIPEGYIQPSGSVEYTENGTYDITDKAQVIVNVDNSGGGDLTVNGILESYKVNEGSTVNAGDFVNYVTKEMASISYYINSADVVALTPNKVLVAYNYGYSVSDYQSKLHLYNFDGSNITLDSTIDFYTSGTRFYAIKLLKIDENRALFIYGGSGTSVGINACVITITGNSISLGMPFAWGQTTANVSAVLLNSNKAFVSYYYSGSNAIILEINGNTVTSGGAFAYSTDGFDITCAIKLSENRVLCSRSYHSFYTREIYLFSINGTNISTITSISVPTASSDIYGGSRGGINALIPVSSSLVVVGYSGVEETSGNQYNRYKISPLTIGENSLTLGSSSNLLSFSYNMEQRTILTSDNSGVIFYSLRSSSGSYYDHYAVAFTADSSGNITKGSSITIATNRSDDDIDIGFGLVNSSLGFLVFPGNTYFMSIDGTSLSIRPSTQSFVKKALNRDEYVGLAKTSGTDGEVVDIYNVEVTSKTVQVKMSASSSYGGVSNVIYDNVTYEGADGETFTAYTGTELYIDNTTGSMTVDIYVNNTFMETLYIDGLYAFLIPTNATSVSIQTGYDTYITYTT